jgi:hypothetical protein
MIPAPSLPVGAGDKHLLLNRHGSIARTERRPRPGKRTPAWVLT